LSEQARIGKVRRKKYRRRVFNSSHHTFIASSYHGAAHSWIHPPINGWIHPVILASLHAFIASSLPRSMHSSRYPCLAPCIHRVISPLMFHYISSYHGSIDCPSSPGSSLPRDPREGPPPRDPRRGTPAPRFIRRLVISSFVVNNSAFLFFTKCDV